MFPTIGDLLGYLLGTHIWLPINTFGFFLASSLLMGGWVVTTEFRRLHAEGKLPNVTLLGKDKKPVVTNPSEAVGNATTIAAIAGIIGARIFHILEYPADFVADPMGMLFSRGGFTFYGGLAFGAAGVIWYFRKLKLPILRCGDAVALCLMSAYALGRMGCQLAGDGDWGIAADMSLKPHWLPNWLWTQYYEGNVIGQKIPPPGVYPTPMYEAIACGILFLILFALRKHKHQAGWLFSLYFIFCGVERFFIELIRTNSHYDLFGIQATQAELIAIILVSLGIAGLAKTWPKETERVAV